MEYNSYTEFGLVVAKVNGVVVVLGSGEMSDLTYDEGIYRKLVNDGDMKIVPYSEDIWGEIKDNPKELNEHLSKIFS